MIGAIVGEFIEAAHAQQPDVAISNYNPHQSTEYKVSADVVLSIALADILTENKSSQHLSTLWMERYQELVHTLPLIASQNGLMLTFEQSKIASPALYVYLLGYTSLRLDEVREESAKIAAVSHEHQQNSMVAQAVATAVFLVRNRFSKRYIKAYFKDQFELDLSLPYQSLLSSYPQDTQPMETVYRALVSLLQSSDFDDAMRISHAIGKANGKQAFITGAIAEAFYQENSASSARVIEQLPFEIQKIVRKFNNTFKVKAKGASSNNFEEARV